MMTTGDQAVTKAFPDGIPPEALASADRALESVAKQFVDKFTDNPEELLSHGGKKALKAAMGFAVALYSYGSVVATKNHLDQGIEGVLMGLLKQAEVNESLAAGWIAEIVEAESGRP